MMWSNSPAPHMLGQPQSRAHIWQMLAREYKVLSHNCESQRDMRCASINHQLETSSVSIKHHQ
eukprot:1231171-Rhodomonas_salina.2